MSRSADHDDIPAPKEYFKAMGGSDSKSTIQHGCVQKAVPHKTARPGLLKMSSTFKTDPGWLSVSMGGKANHGCKDKQYFGV